MGWDKVALEGKKIRNFVWNMFRLLEVTWNIVLDM